MKKITIKLKTGSNDFWDGVLGLSDSPITAFKEKESTLNSITKVWSLFAIKFSLQQGFTLKDKLNSVDFLGTCLVDNQIHYVWNLKHKEPNKEFIDSLVDFKQCSLDKSGLIDLLYKDVVIQSVRISASSEKELNKLSLEELCKIVKINTSLNTLLYYNNFMVISKNTVFPFE